MEQDVGGWRPIADAPMERDILVSDGRVVATAERDMGSWWARCGDLLLWDGDDGGMEIDFEPTHWQPLPDPPSIL